MTPAVSPVQELDMVTDYKISQGDCSSSIPLGNKLSACWDAYGGYVILLLIFLSLSFVTIGVYRKIRNKKDK